MSLEVRLRHGWPSGFDLEVDFATDHRTTALFGPSGAGKTTILMAVAGLVRVDEGRIAWRGRPLLDTRRDLSVPPEARNLGVVFQDQRLFPHLDVAANLGFGARRRRGATAPPLERITRVLDLDRLLDRPTEELSGGERQRVAVGRALMSSPELLLLDEPVAAVDEPRRRSILEYVQRVIHEWDIPMLYVSHHRAEVLRLAEHVVVLVDGRVVDEGPAREVLDPAHAPGVGGDPVNLLRVEAPRPREDGTWTGSLGGGPALRLPAPAGPVPDPAWVQFAPADVILARGDVAGLSARNHIPGRVRAVVPRSGRRFVAVAVADQVVWAEVTAAAVDELGLEPGVDVVCLIKTAALELLG